MKWNLAAAMTLGLAASVVAQSVPQTPATSVRASDVTAASTGGTAHPAVQAHAECGLVPQYSASPMHVGEVTGNPERDSFGLVVIGYVMSCTMVAWTSARAG